jgi:hypothetical protein
VLIHEYRGELPRNRTEALFVGISYSTGAPDGRTFTGKGYTVKRKILRAVSIAAITGAGLFAFSAPAAAHPHDYGYGGGMYSGFNAGFFNGNQYSSVYQSPTSICGNSIAIFGFASAGCHGGAYAINW